MGLYYVLYGTSLLAGTEVFSFAFFGQGSGPIALSQLGCNGEEPNLLSCFHLGLGIHFCGHSEDAGVRCPGLQKITASHANIVAQMC